LRARWLSVFGVSLALLLVRFLVPTPVGQADNRDGPRLMCALGLEPVTHGHARFFRYAYFEYLPSHACATYPRYWSSELVPLVLARLLTPVFGLPGTLNLIALGVLMCVLTAVGIASLATGLRLRLWAQSLIAAVVWLIMADAAFFDVDAGPFGEPAALVGLLLVAAGAVYLGRGGRGWALGLVLAGTGGFLAILSKEQYEVLVVPVCLTLVLAGAERGRRGLDRFLSGRVAAAAAVAGMLVVLAAGYVYWQNSSQYGQRLQHIQAVDMIFTDVVNGHDNAPADLRALGLPASWAKYAGDYYWHHPSVRVSPLYTRYEGRLTDTNIAHFLLTHPGRIVGIGQQAAVLAQRFRVTSLGDYPVWAGHPAGAVESRVAVITWLAGRLPPGLGLWWLLPLWAAMAGCAVAALRLRGGPAWRRGGAVLVLCMTGCAAVAFVPPAYFAGISTTRHMVGSNLATALALTVSLALAISMLARVAAGRGRRLPQPLRRGRRAQGDTPSTSTAPGEPGAGGPGFPTRGD
jgi:hypothetical protein